MFGGRKPSGETPAEAALDTGHPARMLMAEADGNRTRQRRGTPLSGFEDQRQLGRLCS